MDQVEKGSERETGNDEFDIANGKCVTGNRTSQVNPKGLLQTWRGPISESGSEKPCSCAMQGTASINGDKYTPTSFRICWKSLVERRACGIAKETLETAKWLKGPLGSIYLKPIWSQLRARDGVN